VTEKWNGFYRAYMTGADGQGFAMYVFMDGRIIGADPLGVLFDGGYEVSESGELKGEVTVTVPPNGTVIQGVSSGPSGLTYKVPINFGGDLEELDFVRLETPLGPVNLKLEKVRGLER
jgi:hypothetical protein